MSGWWRTNAVALGALVVLVPALVGAIMWNERSEYDAARASQPIPLESGRSVTYGGATVGPVTAEFRDDRLAPTGTRVVSVRIRIAPGDPGLGCQTPALREVGGDDRTWEAASDDLDREWDADHPAYCVSDETEPYTMVVDYIVPDDASGVFSVELASPASLPEFVSAVVDP